MNPKNLLGLEEGLGILSEAFAKATKILEGRCDVRFSSDEYMRFYECSYRLCTQIPDYTAQVYQWYKKNLEHCVLSMVLPSLMDKSGEILLQELSKLWSNYQNMIKYLSISFQYIDRYYVVRENLPSSNEVAFNCFCNLVFTALNGKIRDGVISLFAQEREGKHVDMQLLKSTVSFILSTNDEIKNLYQKEFEQTILAYTRSFYSQKASEWISEYSLSDYLLQIQECLKRENERLSQYFICDNSRGKLLQVIKDQLTSVCESQLKSMGINDPLSLQHYVEMNQDLGLRCANLNLNDGSFGAVQCMNMES